MINIGKYIETAINWLTENFAPLFDAINVGIGGFIDGFQNILMWIPFYVTIALLAILAWYKSGKGVSIFTILGLLLIWGMGFWNETMQTSTLKFRHRTSRPHGNWGAKVILPSSPVRMDGTTPFTTAIFP